MRVKSSEYWQERFTALEEHLKENRQADISEIDAAYKRAEIELQRDIDTWYARLAKNNEINITEARKLLNAKEFEEFRWSVEEYAKNCRNSGGNLAVLKKIENASAKAHIQRLEAMSMQVEMRASTIFAGRQELMRSALKDTYESAYYHTAYEVAKGTGIAKSFAILDGEMIGTAVTKPWAPDGLTFSARIWKDQAKLMHELNREVSRIAIAGISPERAAVAMADHLKVSRSNARRLLLTEVTAMQTRAVADCFAELDVDEYEYVATLDAKTSEICAELDGKVFPMSEKTIGINAPPMHPRCRSCIAPYIGEVWVDVSKRAARDEDGKNYYVASDVTYDEWRKWIDNLSRNKAAPTAGFSVDIKSEWQELKVHRNTRAVDMHTYVIGEEVYMVDGKHVVLDYNLREKAIGDIISSKYGRFVQMVPKINYPKNKRTPDYLIDGISYELKSVKGHGKSVVYDIVKGKKRQKQSSRFILDVSTCPLDKSDILEQIGAIFMSDHTRFVDEVIVFNNGIVEFAYRRI